MSFVRTRPRLAALMAIAGASAPAPSSTARAAAIVPARVQSVFSTSRRRNRRPRRSGSGKPESQRTDFDYARLDHAADKRLRKEWRRLGYPAHSTPGIAFFVAARRGTLPV